MRRILSYAAAGALALAVGALSPSAQAPASPPQAATAAPAFERAPDALPRVTWRTRTLVGDARLTNWKLAVPASGGPGRATFLEGVVRADAAVVNHVEASSTQTVSRGMQKLLNPDLAPDEIAAIRAHMGSVRLLAYRVERLAPDAASRRRLFEFASALGVEVIVVPSNTALDGLDTLADDSGLNVAVMADAARPVRTMSALEGRGRRLGIGVDTGMWAQDGVSPRDALAAVKDRLLYVNLRDRSNPGPAGRDVPLGRGVGNLPELFHELNRLNVRPLAMTLHIGGQDLFSAVEAFEAAVQPAYAAYFTEFSKTRPIRWDVVVPAKGETPDPEVLDARRAEMRRQIDAAIPTQAYATPKKARKLLVIESLHGMSHNTIPHANLMLERMGRITGAWEAVFSNDLTNLTYPGIKDYDAVFLNSIVGEFLPDPDARDGLARYVREGGGVGGVHGTPWASRNWEEFAEIIGAQDAPHRIEQGVMQVYDPASPLVTMFGGRPLPFREEYYRFRDEGPARVRWDKVRVLLTVDLDDPRIEPRPWNGYKRPDNVYPVTWIRSYGSGRVFYCSLGHMPDTFTTPEIVGHFLAGIQFLLGDLEADTTPNPRRGGTTAAQ